MEQVVINFTPVPTKEVMDVEAVINMLYGTPDGKLCLKVDRKQARVIEMGIRARTDGAYRARLSAIRVGDEEVGFVVALVPASGRTRSPSETLPSAEILQTAHRSTNDQ